MYISAHKPFMKIIWKRIIFLANFLIIAILSPGFVLGHDSDKSFVRSETAQLERISMDEAIERALNAIPGKIIETEMEDGIYEIKIRSEEGWVSEIYVDPWDGSILKIKSKHRHKSSPSLND